MRESSLSSSSLEEAAVVEGGGEEMRALTLEGVEKDCSNGLGSRSKSFLTGRCWCWCWWWVRCESSSIVGDWDMT